MQTCIHCGAQMTPARLDHGYRHCSHSDCVRKWRLDRIAAESLTVVLVPKSGFTIVRLADVAGNGKSSGRS